MFKADGTRRDFPITKPRTVVGRKVNCDLRIPLTSVSRQHCEILVEDEVLKVHDLGSSNGTYHNSIRVQEATLGAGDEVVIGPVVFTVVVDGQPDDIKPVRTIIGDAGPGDQSAAGGSSVPEALDAEDDHLDLPDQIEDEAHSPTVDLDDPIAALEALADEDDED
jgi:predicted component of type VI protein secretion system